MGHIRLGVLPQTNRWRIVVGKIASGGSAAEIASATSHAAHKGLEKAQNDPGLCHTLWLLARISLAARQESFGEALQASGVPAPAEPGLFDLVGGFTDALDVRIRKAGRTDLGEIAQLAAVETLTALVSQRANNLFGVTPGDVKQAVYEFSTKKGFSTMAHDFFARFIQRFLTYHLGRELSNHVGGNGRFANPEEHTDFVQHLATHCREAALIVREYAGGWYSKANYEDGISERKAQLFANYSLTKLQRELKIRGERNV